MRDLRLFLDAIAEELLEHIDDHGHLAVATAERLLDYAMRLAEGKATFDAVEAEWSVTFDNATPLAAGDTSIEVVNGAAVGPADAGNATKTYEVHNVGPVNGTITFTIDSVVATV